MRQAVQPDSEFEVSAVVTRPLNSAGPVKHQGNQLPALTSLTQASHLQPAHSLRPSPVEEAALGWGMHPSCILRPPSARDSAFLDHLESLRPDVCITAAYGCILPQRFLDIPRLGTLNVHPSLLPKYEAQEASGYLLCFFPTPAITMNAGRHLRRPLSFPTL
jgi:methionyl-tRNA formyltransferase